MLWSLNEFRVKKIQNPCLLLWECYVCPKNPKLLKRLYHSSHLLSTTKLWKCLRDRNKDQCLALTWTKNLIDFTYQQMRNQKVLVNPHLLSLITLKIFPITNSHWISVSHKWWKTAKRFNSKLRHLWKTKTIQPFSIISFSTNQKPSIAMTHPIKMEICSNTLWN